MKKLLTFAALVAAVSVQAASIDWDLSLGRSGKIVDSENNAINGKVYLILASGADNLATSVAQDKFVDTLAGLTLDDITLSNGKNSENQTATSSSLTARSSQGPQYEFAIVVYDSANDKYFVSGTKKEYAYTAGADDATKVSFTVDEFANPSWADTKPASSPVDPTPGVPEPATGALALAGVALLFKRRRA